LKRYDRKIEVKDIKSITSRLNLGLSIAPGKPMQAMDEYTKTLEKQLSSS